MLPCCNPSSIKLIAAILFAFDKEDLKYSYCIRICTLSSIVSHCELLIVETKFEESKNDWLKFTSGICGYCDLLYFW